MFCLILTVIGVSSTCVIFFFDRVASTEIYTLSLHDALPIFMGEATNPGSNEVLSLKLPAGDYYLAVVDAASAPTRRSEEHTSELQSHSDLVCRLLLEKKNGKIVAVMPREIPVIGTGAQTKSL